MIFVASTQQIIRKFKKSFRFNDLLDVCDEFDENRETDTPWVISVSTLKGIEMKTLSNMSTRLYCMAAAKRQKGATIIEYVLLAALIGVVLIASFENLTTAISTAFTTISGKINQTP
ncbi:Flp family type IVb pilin [Limnohabitans sp.]